MSGFAAARRRLGGLVEAAVPAALGLLAVAEGWRIEARIAPEDRQTLGPGSYLAAIGIGLLLVAVLLAVRARGREAGPPPDGRPWRVPALLGACALFAAILPFVGFAAAMASFFAVAFLVAGGFRPVPALIAALGAGAAFHLLFVTLLDVPFPAASLLAGR